MRHSLLLLLCLSTGCFYTPGPVNPVVEPVLTLGSARQAGYAVRAGAAAEIPSNDRGFAVTSDGAGNFSIAWSDRTNVADVQFVGAITTDGTFSNVACEIAAPGNPLVQVDCPTGAGVNATSAQINIDSIPNTNLAMVTSFTSRDPIYVSVNTNLAAPGIWFVGSTTGALIESQYNPVAFTSP